MNPLSIQTVEMDSRFQDNISPEPSNTTDLSQNCFKTPNINTFNSIVSFNSSLFPTPPSENEDNYHHQNSFYNPYYENIDATNNSTYHSPELVKNIYQTQLYSSPESACSVQKTQDQVPSASIQITSRFKRRSRTTFSKSQLEILEKTFQKSQYPEIKIVDDLCEMLHLSTERVSIWFQNRRARFKKQRKLEAQTTGYGTKDLEKVIKLPSSTSYPISVSTKDKYEYENQIYPMTYATPPYFYKDLALDNKNENVDRVENNTESVYSTQSIPALNQHFYQQQPIYYDNCSQTYVYQNNLSV